MTAPNLMTIRHVKTTIRTLGLVCTRTLDGEYRVNYRQGAEATAYYTTDAEDAIGTARHMSQRAPR